MVHYPAKDADEYGSRAALYRCKAASARERAEAAGSSPRTRGAFLEIAESYESMASSVEDIAIMRLRTR